MGWYSLPKSLILLFKLAVCFGSSFFFNGTDHTFELSYNVCISSLRAITNIICNCCGVCYFRRRDTSFTTNQPNAKHEIVLHGMLNENNSVSLN